MPLEFGDIRHLDEEPLAWNVLEAGLDNTQFHGTTGVDEDLGEFGSPASPPLPEYTFTEVNNEWPDNESPTHISETVLSGVEGECGDVGRINGVTDEASGCMTEQGQHKEESKVMCVPEGLETLVANLVMCGGVHQQQAEKHEVAGDTTGLSVVDIEGGDFPELQTLNVDEVDIVGGGVHDGPENHGISDLTMEPNVLIGGEKPCKPWANDTDDVAQHWEENKTAIVSKNETCTARDPDGIRERVEGAQVWVIGLCQSQRCILETSYTAHLRPPPVDEPHNVRSVEENIEYQPARVAKLSLEPRRLGHLDDS